MSSSMIYSKYVATKNTPQSEPIYGRQQVRNNAGGYVFAVDDWTRLDRFLILGSEGGTYYVDERAFTRDNAEAVIRCVKADGLRTVSRIVEISVQGRAPKNEAALFALAMAAKLGDGKTREAAYSALQQVARIGTHLFHFVDYCKALGGIGGSGFKRALQRWYTQPLDKLALQAVKYQQRDGWSHRDLLRLAHTRPQNETYQLLYRWIVNGVEGVRGKRANEIPIVWAYERARTADTETLISLIRDYQLPWECLPTETLNNPLVWDTLLHSNALGMTALIRNVARMTANGLLKGTSEATQEVCERLHNAKALKKARIHPMAVLLALTTYTRGHGIRSKLSWEPVAQITDALNDAFYTSFDNVAPTGKRLVLALDVSASMCNLIANTHLSCRAAAAALSLITMKTEKNYEIIGFTGDGGWNSSAVSRLSLSSRQRLDDVVKKTSHLDFGATDCSLPMQWALRENISADAFVIYTDNETWCGPTHPIQALTHYRKTTGIPAKLIVVAMTSTGFSIADPDDAGMLDVVGFDAATPNVISDFIRGA